MENHGSYDHGRVQTLWLPYLDHQSTISRRIFFLGGIRPTKKTHTKKPHLQGDVDGGVSMIFSHEEIPPDLRSLIDIFRSNRLKNVTRIFINAGFVTELGIKLFPPKSLRSKTFSLEVLFFFFFFWFLGA